MEFKLNNLYNMDCIVGMQNMKDSSVDITLTDIPYGEVNRKSNGLRDLDKKNADIETFELEAFLNEVYRVTKGTIIIFCGNEQYSTIYQYFSHQKKGTTRHLIWQKSNPSPMNGQYIYLSGIENAVWYKKPGAAFNAHCKNTVFVHPNGRNKLHPTEKNMALIKELIEDNSNASQIFFDPCAGGGTHLLAAKELGRNYIGFELDESYFKIAQERLK